jgi:hypothetical protein
MIARTRLGALIALAGFLLILVGLFSGIGGCYVPGVPCPSPRLDEIFGYSGLALLLIGIGLLLRAGWRGSLRGSLFAAVAAVPATWFLYELARQSGCVLITDQETQRACLEAFGEMTAPVLSAAVACLVVVVGWLRWRRVGFA